MWLVVVLLGALFKKKSSPEIFSPLFSPIVFRECKGGERETSM